MSKNILIRSGTSPYDKYTTSEYLNKDLGGGNSGNLLFAASLFRNINNSERICFSNYYNLSLSSIDYVNQNYSCFIIPLANAFRSNFGELEKLTQFVKKLKIPCIVTGVGGQFDYDPDFSQTFEFDKRARDFCLAILEKSLSIGVRGEITADYMKKRLGISEDKIDIIGCPSIFWYGPNCPKIKSKKEIYESTISIHAGASIDPYLWSLIHTSSQYFAKRYFVPQGNYDLRILYSGESLKKLSSDYPSSLFHPLYKHNKVRFFTRADSWINFYQNEIDCSLGIKIHGTIAGVLGGARVLLLATDSRTRELAEFHHIPFIKARKDIKPFDLLNIMSDSTLMNDFCKNYKDKYTNFKNFMLKNGIKLSENETDLKTINNIDDPTIGHVTSFYSVPDSEKIHRITNSYLFLSKKISKLQEKLREPK